MYVAPLSVMVCAAQDHGSPSLPSSQAPRADVVPDILGMLYGAANYQEFGALDGLTPAEIAFQTKRGSERRLYTRLRSGRAARLADAAAQLRDADLILMHSVDYSEGNARRMAIATGKPVVTARRIIVGAMRLRLSELGAAPRVVSTHADRTARKRSTRRSLAAPDSVSDAARAAGTGGRDERRGQQGHRPAARHQTVKIHRGRAMNKLETRSPAELIRRVLLLGAAGG
jgi:hypothetical protein